MIKYTVLFLIFCSLSFAQNEWEKWGKKDIDYKFEVPPEREYNLETESLSVTFVSLLKNTYWFLFSDHDGDNCPFHPTCSEFFLESVKETNILKGALMFADRFTRDSNLFKSRSHYPLYENGKFFDPVYNYQLEYNKIKYIPSENIVTND